ncbi:MAG TPA: hypothetical protein VGX25_02695 [Actinophytocola sp.]|uniref:hypothetical protein n=1 Tax=Actinophytocola sp. TaxID=1872138 RepID=UPI002DDD6784|nr:hypothetical protein [Actinophytocola sp.]HEV2778285.1 hypothetical protein [Actinophytocola sp.]
MAVGRRVAGVLPLAGATAAAMALAGIAVFSVSQAGCAEPGHYVEHNGTVELVGSCLDPGELPSAPVEHKTDQKPAEPASLSG